MSIPTTGSMTAATCAACSWIAETAKSAGTGAMDLATKVANLATAAFQALSQYTSVAFQAVTHYASTGTTAIMNALRAHPQVAVGAVAVALIATGIYAYTQSNAV